LLYKKQKQEVADESVLDTMMDLANYSIMLASKYRREKDAVSKV